MTVDVVTYTRDELLAHRQEILERVPDIDDLRRRADDHNVSADERESLIDLEEVDFLLGDDG